MLKPVCRQTIRGGVVVSTVRTDNARYETAFIVGGVTSDPLVSASKADALAWHDAACDYVNSPSRREAGRRTHAIAVIFGQVAAG